MPDDPKRRDRRLRLLALAVLLTAAAVALAAGAQGLLDLQGLADRRATLVAFVDARPVGSALLYVGLYALCIAVSLPGSWWFTTVGGFLFGWAAGFPLALFAATLGATVIFLGARSSFAEALVRRAGPRLRTLAGALQADSFAYLLVIRLIPFFPFWLVNLAAGVVGLRLRAFVPATLLGAAPSTLAFAVAGSGLDAVIENRLEAQAACRAAGRGACPLSVTAADLLVPEVLAALALIGLLAVAALLLKRRFAPHL